MIRQESAELGHYLAGLSSAAWATPSACQRWEVRDVAAHLVNGTEAYTYWVRRGIGEDPSPPEGRPDPSAWDSVPVDEKRRRALQGAQSAVSRREREGEELLAILTTIFSRFHSFLDGLGPQDWEMLCYHPRGIIPAQTLASYSVLEIGIHSWDIRSVLDSVAQMSDASVAYIVKHLAEYLHWPFVGGDHGSESVRYRFELRGAVSSNHDLVVLDGKPHVEPVTSRPADATFHCEAESFVLLLFGRTSLQGAMQSGRLTAKGDDRAVAVFSHWFQGAF